MDQKIKADAGKPRLGLVPFQIVYDIAEVREYGLKKYPDGGKDNWKRVEIQRYRDALLRHALAYIDTDNGEDPESGLKHLAHLATNVAFLCALEKEKPEEPEQEEQKEEQKPELKKPRQKIDYGKIMALRNAGWTVRGIAEEMQCSDQTVYNVIKSHGEQK